MNTKTAKPKPTREQLVALAKKLVDAPAVGNNEQAAMWVEIGKADGWAALTHEQKAAFRVRFEAAK